MKINNFISKYKNHPVLFIGTGISLRYLENSYNWNGLLSKIAIDLFDNDRKYLDIKARFSTNQGFIYESIAEELEKQFNDFTEKNPNGKFKDINDIFYDKIRNENTVLSRFKIYISKLLSSVIYRQNIENELHELKLAKKNIGSIITTNYDCLIEDLFEFNPLIGNDILLSNPYGTVDLLRKYSSHRINQSCN